MYLGRFICFNSWDFFTQPFAILEFSLSRILHPAEHIRTWVFTLIVSFMLMLFYYTLNSTKQAAK